MVLGGGGLAGIAWETGVLATLLDQGIRVDVADLVVGTSAGSVTGAALRFGVVDQLLAAQLRGDDPAEKALEESELASFSPDTFTAMLTAAAAGAGGQQEARARLGAEASAAGRELSEDDWVATIRDLLPARDWPAWPFQVTAVNADDGAFTVFEESSGVELARAVAASCSVPGAWPPVTIDGRPYMDGGTRSASNADLAAGYGKVLVLSCAPEDPESPFGPSLPQVLRRLEGSTDTFLIEADAPSLAAFGSNVLLGSTRRPAAAAGQRQAAGVLEAVRAFWG